MTIRRTSGSVVVSAGLPVLSAGAHLAPEDGLCLMEFVSVLAGERFTDSPRCTEPTLAFLARLVNDMVTDADRSLLAPVAADLSRLGRVDAGGSLRLVLAVVRRARATTPANPRLRRAEHRTQQRLQGMTQPRRLDRLARALIPVYVRGAGWHRLETAVWAVADAPWPDEIDRDRALVELLQLAMTVIRGELAGQPTTLDHPDASCGHLPVEPHDVRAAALRPPARTRVPAGRPPARSARAATTTGPADRPGGRPAGVTGRRPADGRSATTADPASGPSAGTPRDPA